MSATSGQEEAPVQQEQGGNGFYRRHRALVVASLTTWILLGLAYASYRAFGRAAVTSIYESEGENIVRGRLEWASNVARAVPAATVAIWVLVVAAYFVIRARAFKWLLPVLLAWWIGVETFAAPYFVHYLRLVDYYYVTDPDHWPRDRKEGDNADVVRCPWEPEEFRPEGTNILFLGDSFTFGAILPADKAFPYLVGRALQQELPDRDVKFANFGWESSSPLLSCRRLRHLGEKYHPDVVALFVDMTDFHDDIRYECYLDRVGVYGWIARLPLTMHFGRMLFSDFFEDWRKRSVARLPEDRFFITEAPLEETLPHCARIHRSIDEIAELCRSHGWKFLLYLYPRCYQVSEREAPNSWEKSRYTTLGPYCLEPFRWLDEYVRPNADYPVYSLLDAFATTDVFPTCFDYDPHWNEAGHRVAAEAILETLRREL